MDRRKLLVALSRLSGFGTRRISQRAATVCRGGQTCERSMNLTFPRRNFSAGCSSLLKDEAVNPDSEKDAKSKRPPMEPDDETRSILNDIWHDFEVCAHKTETPSEVEGPTGAPTPAVPASPKNRSPQGKDRQRHPDSEPAPFREGRMPRNLYSDEDATVILDATETTTTQLSAGQDIEYYPENVKIDHFEGLNLERGESGVFEVEELVEVLRDEKLTDIAVIAVPEEMVYTDYLVLCTAVSPRHSRGVAEFLKKLYKRKKDKTDPTLFIEGEQCPEWKVLDMGNVVLHIFLPEAREHYDIETLWTVGSTYDDLTHSKDDPVFNMLQQQIQLLQENEAPKDYPRLSGIRL
uniref:Mitochondrial assembly of ribosomal large subunit protein 1 n=1 Tax=Ixodes ricinus TaxID=34613 RepID=A0A090XDE1_IXORI